MAPSINSCKIHKLEMEIDRK